jgi:putative CocE/NonD family hydrolase
MGGWYDPFLPAQLDDFERIRRSARPDIASASRLIVGPWAHARGLSLPEGAASPNYRIESFASSIPWFDQHLRGGAVAFAAPVRIFVMGENLWRDEEEWPLVRTRYSDFFLRSGGKANGASGDGRLSSTPPTDAEPADEFVYDPLDPVPSAGGAMIGPRAGIVLQNKIEERQDVLVYTAAPLEEDLEVTGQVKLVLHVSTTAAHTDFTAKLVDVFADGSAYNVCDGILRRAYGDEAPGEITLDLWPTSRLFRKGHRIRLEVSSSNFPRFDRNPNTGKPIATETQTQVARQTIYHDLANPSRLILPVIPRPAT